jgi:hypothetical protein
MGFWKDLVSDDNHINEKSVIGIASFGVMVLCMVVDLVTGALNKPLLINEFIFNAFLTITLGSFGIGSIDKFINKKAENDKLKIEADKEEELG